MTTPPDPQAAAIRIGLTGNIATGKTTVGRMLEALGAELIDADQVSHAVMAPGGPAYGPVVAAFGDGILAEDNEIDPVASPPIGHAADPPIDHEVDRSISREAERPVSREAERMINRAALGRLVFSDPDALARLEALVHPVVIAEVERRIADSAARVIVVEAIKLLESGMADTYDAIWVTTCSEATQLARLMEGRGLSREAALARIHAQPPRRRSWRGPTGLSKPMARSRRPRCRSVRVGNALPGEHAGPRVWTGSQSRRSEHRLLNRQPLGCQRSPVPESPVSESPVSEPPVSEPPASEPPASEPPASEPPASEPHELVP